MLISNGFVVTTENLEEIFYPAILKLGLTNPKNVSSCILYATFQEVIWSEFTKASIIIEVC